MCATATRFACMLAASIDRDATTSWLTWKRRLPWWVAAMKLLQGKSERL